MKLIHIIFVLVLVGCASAVADQQVSVSDPVDIEVTNELEFWDIIAEQALIIEALQAEIIALQEDGANYGYVYEVQEGESLWLIADSVLGDPYRWITIYTMNYWMDNPDLIYPRQVLLLP